MIMFMSATTPAAIVHAPGLESQTSFLFLSQMGGLARDTSTRRNRTTSILRTYLMTYQFVHLCRIEV